MRHSRILPYASTAARLPGLIKDLTFVAVEGGWPGSGRARSGWPRAARAGQPARGQPAYPVYFRKIFVKSSAYWDISEQDGSPDAEPEHGWSRSTDQNASRPRCA